MEAPSPPVSPSPEPSKAGVKSVAEGAVQLYRNINKVDRWGGGGFSLSTIVKLAGWAGLIAILAVLVMKLREVEEQLDPVTSIVTKLMKEVDASRVVIRQHTEQTRAELDGLHQEAIALKASVIKTEEAEAAARHAVEDVDQRAHSLSEELEAEVARAATLGSQGETAAQTLQAYTRNLTDIQTQLKTTADQANANAKAISESLKRAAEQTAVLEKSLAALQTSSTQASLAKADTAAKDLAQALDRATAKVKTMDNVVERKTKPAEAPRTVVAQPSASK
jgi:chromosome segregation ATPase